MQNPKLLALVVGALAAVGGASFALFGTAQAATWHDYQGDLYAGHAYGLQVPPSAKSYEVRLDGDSNATATLALFDPEGKALGYHALDQANPAVTIEEPAEGRHVIYVYDLTAGALKLRVDSPLAPLTANLQKMPLHKNDVTLASSDAAAPLDLSNKQDLASTPVFLTLLYEGSVQGLDATISSAKGDVVTIRGESGTAFSPGVWSTLKGERASSPENLDGLAFTVAASAQRFEGTLILTSLTIDHKAPQPAPEQPTQAPPPAPAPAPAPLPVNGAFTAPIGKPIAFTATAGALRITDVEAAVQREGDEPRSEYWAGALAIYKPDDSLLAFVELDYRHPNATVKLPVDGEYVMFVHDAHREGFLVQLVGASTVSGIRELATATEELDLDLSSGLFGIEGQGEAFTLQHAPIAMKGNLSRSSDAAISGVYVTNDNGVVLSVHSFLQTGGFTLGDGSYASPENFAAGEHTLQTQGFTEGKLHLVSTYYVRHDAPAVVAEPAEAPAATEVADSAGLLGILGL